MCLMLDIEFWDVLLAAEASLLLFMYESFGNLNWTSAIVASFCCQELLVLSATWQGELCFYLRMGWFFILNSCLVCFPCNSILNHRCMQIALFITSKNKVLWFVCLLRSWALLTYPHKVIPWLLTLFCFFLLVFVLPQIAPVSLSCATSQPWSFHFFIRVWELICFRNCFYQPSSHKHSARPPFAPGKALWVNGKTLREPELIQ